MQLLLAQCQVDAPADLPVFFKKFEVAVKKFIKRVSDQWLGWHLAFVAFSKSFKSGHQDQCREDQQEDLTGFREDRE